MMRHLLAAIILVVFILSHSAPALANFEAGADAYARGDYATALQEWQPLAEAGNLAAQFNLGLMHYNGEGESQNYGEAAKWFELAAEQGDAAAQINLGIMAFNGQGMEQDFAQAHFWFALAARLFPLGPERDQASQNLAIAGGHLDAELIAANERKAEEWRLRLAASQLPAPGTQQQPEAPPITEPQQVARTSALIKTDAKTAGEIEAVLGAAGAPEPPASPALIADAQVAAATSPAHQDQPTEVLRTAEEIAAEIAAAFAAEEPTNTGIATGAHVVKATPPVAQVPPPKATQKIAAVAANNGFAIQLGSLRSRDAAKTEIARLKTLYKDLLQKLELTVQRAEIAERGTFYRIHTARFPSKGAANEICGQLKTLNQACLVVRR